jgi:hypothetical protein
MQKLRQRENPLGQLLRLYTNYVQRCLCISMRQFEIGSNQLAAGNLGAGAHELACVGIVHGNQFAG